MQLSCDLCSEVRGLLQIKFTLQSTNFSLSDMLVYTGSHVILKTGHTWEGLLASFRGVLACSQFSPTLMLVIVLYLKHI